ncbi:MAG: AAA family ATPase, partial [Arcobacter sp.]|nr:AAA family ATPase [Arcobacter sp.]
FSRRFNYKIEFTKPTNEQRAKLWSNMLPSTLHVKTKIDIIKLATFDLTGGQIEMIIKNTAYKIAVEDEPIFATEDFIEQIEKERKNMFDKEHKVGFFQ